jgi:gamma-glutamyltranspeptidase
VSHPQAAVVGTYIVKKGENTVDVAIATAFTLTVVAPCMCGITDVVNSE